MSGDHFESDGGPDSGLELPATPKTPNSAGDLAREAMERARASARQRGAARISPTTAARRQRERKAQTDQELRSAQPFEPGRDPRPMGQAVEALLKRMGWTEAVEVASVTARWREVIGDQIADHCEPLSFEDGILTLRASSTAWATQMTLMQGQIRHRINEEFGRDVVKDIKVFGPTARSWNKGPRTVKGRGPRDTYG